MPLSNFGQGKLSRSLAGNIHQAVLTVALLLWALPAFSGYNEWTSGSPLGSPVNAIAVQPSSQGAIYAGTESGIFRSTDGGGSWSQAGTGRIKCLAIDPATPTTVYAGGPPGFFRSTDGGDSWEAAFNGLSGSYIDAVAVDPLTPATVYAGDYGGGVFKSTDGARNWNQVNSGLTSTNVTSIIIDPNTPSTLYAGTWSGGVFKSTNGGTSWSQMNAGLTYPNITSLSLDPKNSAIIYAGTFSGVFKSANGGADWSRVSTGLPEYTRVGAIAIDPSAASTVYAVLGNNIYKSSNGGAGWSLANAGLAGRDVTVLAAQHSALYAGTAGGVVNVMQVVVPVATKVSPLPGTFTSALRVTLTTNKPASIYYTTDGSDPETSGSRQLYSAPVSLSATTTVKYCAVDEGGTVEPAHSALYKVIDPQELVFTHGGTAPWFEQGTVTYDGIGAYQSGAIGNSQSSWMETTVNGPGAVRFRWKVSSEQYGDRLWLDVDGISVGQIRGEVDWQQQAFQLGEGSHTLRWTYSTNSYTLSGANAGWVDQIIFEPANAPDVLPPATTATPAGGMFVSDPAVSLACNDGSGGGCAATYYCFGDDCSPTTPFTGEPVTVRGQSVLRYYSVDAAGNMEAVKSDTYTITTDRTPPTTRPNHPTGAYNDPNISLYCYDGTGVGCGATYYCLGTGCTPTTLYSNSPVYLAAPSLSYYSKDLAGNAEPVKTSTYVIDTLAPTSAAFPGGGTYRSAQQVTLTCSDGSGAGCTQTYYCMGSGCYPGTTYSAPFAITASTDLRFFSRDAVTNQESVQTVRYVVQPADPATIRVPADKAAIQDAIDAAADGDTILVAPGVYPGGIDFKGKGVTVRSSDGPDVTIIDGGRTRVGVKFLSGEGPSSVLQGFTVTNGKYSDSDTPCTGGGICIMWSSPRITGNRITGNYGCAGVGIQVVNASPVIEGNIIAANSRTTCTGGGGGAGISVSYGAGTSLLNNEIYDNDTADGSGGGISLYVTSNVTLKGNTIRNNRAAMSGGGISVSGGTVNIIQNLVAANKASKGGGIYLSSSGSILVNNTIANNEGSTGSAVFTNDANTGTTLANNVISASPGQSAIYCESRNNLPPPAFKNNIAYSPSQSAYGGACGDLNGVDGNITADPGLNNPALGLYALLPGSPAIDAGDSSFTTLPGTDLDGLPRALDGNGDAEVRVDLGAYEHDPTMPRATLSGVPAPFSNLTSATLSVGGEGITSYRYSLDGAPFTTADSAVAAPVLLADLADGSHSLAVIGKNASRAQSVANATSRNWVVDTAAPVTVASLPGGAFAEAQQVTLSCSDGTGAGCENTYYCLGSNCLPDTPYHGEAIAVAASTDLRYFSTDKGSNREEVRTAAFAIVQTALIEVTPSSWNAGALPVGSMRTETFTIRNTGTMPLVITSPVSSEGTDRTWFRVGAAGPNPCPGPSPTIAPGSSCTVTAAFYADSPGVRTATLQIPSNADNFPLLQLPMAGTATTVPGRPISWSGNGPFGGSIRALVIDPASPATVYAGTADAGAFKSTNGGQSWSQINNGLFFRDIHAMAIDPATTSTLYAGTFGGGIFKSTDSGETWQSLNSVLSNRIYALAIDPHAPATIYAATDGSGIFKSTDGGNSWQLSLADYYAWTIAIDPVTPSTLYAGTPAGVYKTTDAGGSWRLAGLTGTDVRTITVSPQAPGTIYAGSYGKGLFKSTNGGADWSKVAGLASTRVQSVAIDPAAENTVYAGTYGEGVFKSTDGGNSWSQRDTAIRTSSVYALAIDPGTPATIYAGAVHGGVWKSVNQGDEWSAVNAGLTAAGINALALDPGDPATVYAGTRYGGLFKTTDNGNSWISAGQGLGDNNILAVTIDPTDAATLYAGTSGAGAFKSTDEGASWYPINQGLTSFTVTGVNCLVVDPSAPNILYAGTHGGSVYKSTNGGDSWFSIFNGMYGGNYVLALALDPASPATLYAASYYAGVWRSTNGGDSWREVNSGLPTMEVHALAIDPAAPATLYAGTVAGIYKSTNSGDSWLQVNNELAGSNSFAIAIDPQSPGTLYAGRYGENFDRRSDKGVFRSTDGGKNWSPLASGQASASINAIVIAPTTPTRVYAGTLSGGVVAWVNAPEIAVVSQGDFGTVAATASRSENFALSNTGTAPLVFDSPVGTTGQDFSVTAGGPFPCPTLAPTLAPGETCTVVVTFAPLSTGNKQDVLHVYTNAINTSRLEVPLTGVAVPPTPLIAVASASLTFGSQALGAPVTVPVTISNIGTQDVVVNSPLRIVEPDSNSFSVAPGGPSPCPSLAPVIPMGGSCTVAVTFTPIYSGTTTATLRVISNAANNPVVDLPLTGTAMTGAVIGSRGDCDGNGSVSIAEVQSAINMLLALKPPAQCVDVDHSGEVGIAEVQTVINAFLGL